MDDGWRLGCGGRTGAGSCGGSRGHGNFAAGFPGFGQEFGAAVDVFLVGFLEACGDDGDFYGVFHRFVLHGAEDDVGIFVGGLLDDGRGFMNFVQGEAGAAADVDEDALSALDGIVFEQRAGDGAVGGVNGAIRTGGDCGTHDGVALARHDGFDVRKIAIDDAGDGDDVRDALHRLAENVVGDAESVEEAGSALDGFHETFVGDDDDSVHGADQILKSLFGLQHAALALKGKRLGDHGDSESA